MYTQGTGQCIVTHDETRWIFILLLCVFTLFSGSFKSTTLMMRAHILEMHTQTGQCMVMHDDTRVDLLIVVMRISLFTVNF